MNDRRPAQAHAGHRGQVMLFPKLPRSAVQVTLWEGQGPPVEEDLRARLVAEGYQVVRWRNEPATGYPPHAHIYPELLWLVAGSLTIVLPAEGRLLYLAAGDRAELPQGLTHGSIAGPEGAVYLLATR